MLVRKSNREVTDLGLRCLSGPFYRQIAFEVLDHYSFIYFYFIYFFFLGGGVGGWGIWISENLYCIIMLS